MSHSHHNRQLLVPSSSPDKITITVSDSNSDIEENRVLNSRVTFSKESIVIEDECLAYNQQQLCSGAPLNASNDSVEDPNRAGWDNKLQFFMGVISYAVGLGNVWRFPYLCQKNGGGAFLIPYGIMMLLEGMPLFLIEMGIGQRLRTGPIGVWNAIHPYLGGVGISAAVVSLLVALYYNVIITWCLYYLSQSLRLTLNWAECPIINGNMTQQSDECQKSSSPTSYYWYRNALETSGSIGEVNRLNWHMTICLVVAWTVVYLCVMKGIKTSGKVMYVTATFPYLVTTIFLVRSVMLDGAGAGIAHMFTPDLNRLIDPNVWLDAATQIFYSMGLGFGGLIAFASYNPIKNNVKRDTVTLSLANIVTSLYTALVIFSVLGFMASTNYNDCLNRDMQRFLDKYPKGFPDLIHLQQQRVDYEQWMATGFPLAFNKMNNISQHCNFKQIIEEAAEGTGLAFVVFTEAMIQFPFPPIWAVMFFMMLLMLGLGSMFGTLEGVITSLFDMNLFPWLKKPVLTGVLCSTACLIGLVFVTDAGQYWVSLFDQFAGSYALLLVAFFEIMAVVYVYGFRRFCRDIEFMTGEYPSKYWQFTWRFISPSILFVLFFASLAKSFSALPTYFAYNAKTARLVQTPYPKWALIIAVAMVLSAAGPVPFVWFVRKFKIWKFEGDIPAAAKQLGSTPSTTRMLDSTPSFNRLQNVSTASELQTVGLVPSPTQHRHNGTGYGIAQSVNGRLKAGHMP